MPTRERRAKRLGIPVDQLPDGRGKTGTQPKGPKCHRWNDGGMKDKQGYRLVRVGRSHPLACPNGYCREHVLVWVSAGNQRPLPGEVLHHKNGVRTDNRIENIEIMSKTKHGILHAGAISDEAVRQIRERYAAGTDGTVLAKEYGIPMQRIYLYLKGEARCGSGGPIQGGSLRRNANRSRSGRKAAGRLLDGRQHDGWFR